MYVVRACVAHSLKVDYPRDVGRFALLVRQASGALVLIIFSSLCLLRMKLFGFLRLALDRQCLVPHVAFDEPYVINVTSDQHQLDDVSWLQRSYHVIEQLLIVFGIFAAYRTGAGPSRAFILVTFALVLIVTFPYIAVIRPMVASLAREGCEVIRIPSALVRLEAPWPGSLGRSTRQNT